jgi:hypothetical protein
MTVRPPNLGVATDAYDRRYWDRILSELRSYFDRANQAQPLRGSTLNINIGTLPTQASLATLASGDVYVDTTASYVLKIKP